MSLAEVRKPSIDFTALLSRAREQAVPVTNLVYLNHVWRTARIPSATTFAQYAMNTGWPLN